MKILIKTFLIMAIIIAFYACEDPGISDGEVISFTVDGIVGDAVINSVSKNINLTLEPMDISTIDNPTIITSEGATFQVPTLQDGVAVEFNVTAADGTVEVWSVTATVQFGISFDLNGEHIVSTFGLADTTNIYTDTQLVNNKPVCWNPDGISATFVGYNQNRDILNIHWADPEAGFIHIELTDTAPYDTITFATNEMTFSYVPVWEAGNEQFYLSSATRTGSTVTANSVVINDIQGANCFLKFSGKVLFEANNVEGALFDITNGFAKTCWVDVSQL